MQIAQRRKDFQHIRDRFGDGQLVTLATLERLPTDVLHDDVADGLTMLIGVLDEVEDLHDRGMDHLGEESPLSHRDRLRFGVTGMDQAFEHNWAVVDVSVQREVHPAQPAVRDATFDLVLAGHHVARIELRQKRIRTTAMRAIAFGLSFLVFTGSANRPSAVPAEPLRLRHNRIRHQRFEGIDVRHARNLDEPAAQPANRGTRRRFCSIRWRGVADMYQEVVVIVVEVGSEDRLGRNRTALCRGVDHRVGGLGTRTDLVRVLIVGFHRLLCHQSTYLGLGGAGAGPSTVNHLRYNVFHVPSRRSRSRVPLTNRTNPVLSNWTPMP